MGYRKRVDRNQAEIVDALRRTGWHVEDTSSTGRGFPDLVVARGSRLLLLEVKDGTKPLYAQALTPAEAMVHRDFAAAGVIVRLVRSVEDVIAL